MLWVQRDNGVCTEVISFVGFVNIATERNRAYFDRFGLPTNWMS